MTGDIRTFVIKRPLKSVKTHGTEVICGHLTFFFKQSKALSRLCKLYHYKTTGRSCRDEVHVKESHLKR